MIHSRLLISLNPMMSPDLRIGYMLSPLIYTAPSHCGTLGIRMLSRIYWLLLVNSVFRLAAAVMSYKVMFQVEYAVNTTASPLNCIRYTVSSADALVNNGNYAKGTLRVTKATDEDGKVQYTFTDK